MSIALQKRCLKVVCLAFFVVFLVLPLLKIIGVVTPSTIADTVKLPIFRKSLLNSLALALSVSITATLLALVCALLIRESAKKARQFLLAWLTIPTLIPSISHGMGLLYLLSPNGVLFRIAGVHVNAYGFPGLYCGLVLLTTPVGIIMMYDKLQYESIQLHVEALALDLSVPDRFRTITFPFLKRTILRCAVSIFIIAYTDFGISMMIGGKTSTLSLLFVNEILGRLNLERCGVYAIFLGAPSLVLFFMSLSRKSRERLRVEKFQNSRNIYCGQTGRTVSTIGMVLVAVLITVPILIYLSSSFYNRYTGGFTDIFASYREVFRQNILQYGLNSLIIAIAAATLGAALSLVSAYVVSKSSGMLSSMVGFCSLLPLSVPGLVLGFGFILMFKATFLKGTYLILILASMTHFFSIPYTLSFNALESISHDNEILASVFNIKPVSMLLNIYMPQTAATIIEMFVYIFVNSMITISITIMLFGSKTMPLAIMITQYEAQLLIEYSAVVTMVILGINSGIKALAYGLRRKTWNGERA